MKLSTLVLASLSFCDSAPLLDSKTSINQFNDNFKSDSQKNTKSLSGSFFSDLSAGSQSRSSSPSRTGRYNIRTGQYSASWANSQNSKNNFQNTQSSFSTFDKDSSSSRGSRSRSPSPSRRGSRSRSPSPSQNGRYSVNLSGTGQYSTGWANSQNSRNNFQNSQTSLATFDKDFHITQKQYSKLQNRIQYLEEQHQEEKEMLSTALSSFINGNEQFLVSLRKIVTGLNENDHRQTSDKEFGNVSSGVSTGLSGSLSGVVSGNLSSGVSGGVSNDVSGSVASNTSGSVGINTSGSVSDNSRSISENSESARNNFQSQFHNSQDESSQIVTSPDQQVLNSQSTEIRNGDMPGNFHTSSSSRFEMIRHQSETTGTVQNGKYQWNTIKEERTNSRNPPTKMTHKLEGVKRTNANKGVLTVQYDGQWGTVCDDDFGQREADVACRAMGYDGAIYFANVNRSPGYSSPNNMPILLDEVECKSGAKSLLDCNAQLYRNNCNHGEDVVLECYHAARMVQRQ